MSCKHRSETLPQSKSRFSLPYVGTAGLSYIHSKDTVTHRADIICEVVLCGGKFCTRISNSIGEEFTIKPVRRWNAYRTSHPGNTVHGCIFLSISTVPGYSFLEGGEHALISLPSCPIILSTPGSKHSPLTFGGWNAAAGRNHFNFFPAHPVWRARWLVLALPW